MQRKTGVLSAIVVSVCLCGSQIFGQADRILLSQAYPEKDLADLLLAPAQWRPYATIADRHAWQALLPEIRMELLTAGEAGLAFDWPALPATRFLEYARNGNRSNYQNIRNIRRDMLRDLILAECVEAQGRFLDDIVNGIWTTCEETYWGVPAHLSLQAAGPGLPDVTEPTVDLFAAETAALLAWSYYLLGERLDTVSPLVRPRIKLEIQKRVLTPCLERDDFWWMGFGERRNVNNWNPWICSNWLTATLLMEQDAERRVSSVAKAMRTIDNFLRVYPSDGGCDEGPGYWGRAGASLFECLELLYSASNGAINVYDAALIKEIGRYIYRVHIADDYFINFADAAAIVAIAADLTYRYGKRIRDDAMMAFSAYAVKSRQTLLSYDSIGRILPALFNYPGLRAATAAPPCLRDVWLPDLQVMAARSTSGSAAGLFVAAKGGHNNESHNHNDVGNFIVYYDGKPVIIDIGVETYTKKTFSSQRYEIWTMQSAYHNLPTIGDVMQAPGRNYAARDVTYAADDGKAELTLDIAGAYPEEARINSWHRTVRLNRGRSVTIIDSFALGQKNDLIKVSLMTPLNVDTSNPGVIALQDDNGTDGGLRLTLRYDSAKLAANSEAIVITDDRLKRVWGGKLQRILLSAKHATDRDTWSVEISP